MCRALLHQENLQYGGRVCGRTRNDLTSLLLLLPLHNIWTLRKLYKSSLTGVKSEMLFLLVRCLPYYCTIFIFLQSRRTIGRTVIIIYAKARLLICEFVV